MKRLRQIGVGTLLLLLAGCWHNDDTVARAGVAWLKLYSSQTPFYRNWITQDIKVLDPETIRIEIQVVTSREAQLLINMKRMDQSYLIKHNICPPATAEFWTFIGEIKVWLVIYDRQQKEISTGVCMQRKL